MSQVLERIHKLRKLSERQARMDLAHARYARDSARADLDATTHRMAHAASHRDAGNASDLHENGVYALRMEMVRRTQRASLAQHEDHVARKVDDVKAAAKQARVAERIVELRQERVDADRRRADQRAGDDAGLQTWQRRLTRGAA